MSTRSNEDLIDHHLAQAMKHIEIADQLLEDEQQKQRVRRRRPAKRSVTQNRNQTNAKKTA